MMRDYLGKDSLAKQEHLEKMKEHDNFKRRHASELQTMKQQNPISDKIPEPEKRKKTKSDMHKNSPPMA